MLDIPRANTNRGAGDKCMAMAIKYVVSAGAAASFQLILGDLRPGHKPDISLEKYKAVIKLLVAATAGCQGAKN